MKTSFKHILSHLQKWVLVTACLLAVSGLEAQAPQYLCSVKLPRPYKINWKAGPAGMPPNQAAFTKLVKAAANAWNQAWTMAGKPGKLLVYDSLGNVLQCSCNLKDTLCSKLKGDPENVRHCVHGGQHNDEVSMCRDSVWLGAETLYNPPVGTLDSVNVEALAVTYYDCEDSCMVAADICVEFAFKNCKLIPWYIELNPPAIGPIGFNEFDMLSVLVHEFGHYLGLGHSFVNPLAVMYPTIRPGQIKRIPNPQEIMAITPCVCKCDND